MRIRFSAGGHTFVDVSPEHLLTLLSYGGRVVPRKDERIVCEVETDGGDGAEAVCIVHECQFPTFEGDEE